MKELIVLVTATRLIRQSILIGVVEKIRTKAEEIDMMCCSANAVTQTRDFN